MMNYTYLEWAFFTVVGIQLIYWSVWLIGVLKLKATTNNSSSHGVSIIIAANNELNNLQTLLPTLLNQSYSKFEIIVVNDRSTDGTYDYLLALAQQESTLKVLTVNELPLHLNGKKYALTLGIKSAAYDQILLTDADCKPITNEWVSSFANQLDGQTSFILGFSCYDKNPGLLNYFIRFETLLTGIQYVSAAVLGKPYMGVGRNLSYSKNLFLSKKGFHGFQGLMGGDDDLFVNKYANGTNTKVVLNNQSIISSRPKLLFSDFMVQKIRHLSVGKYYSSKSKITLGLFAFTWLATWALAPFEAVTSQSLILFGILLCARYVLMGATFYIFTNKSGAKLNLLGLILLDFMFVLYYFVTGIRTLLTKRVKWS